MRGFWKLTFSLFTAGSVLLASSLAAAPAGASPQSKHDKVLARADQAASRHGAPHGTKSGQGVSVPSRANTAAKLQTPTGTLEMGIPATGNGDATDEGVVFDTASSAATIVVQSTEEGGLRALINIDSADAPERYAFPISGDVVSLALDATGGVGAFDASGSLVAYAEAPWAVDADGTPVPTHYEIDGTTLYQVIGHHAGNYQYGIVADPWWNPFSWNWGAIFQKLWSCASGAFQFVGLSAVGYQLTESAFASKLAQAGLKLKSVVPGGVWVAAAAGCVYNVFSSYR